MALAPLQTKNLESQEIIYNELSKTLILQINDPFYKAGHLLSWDLHKYGSPGFGVNQSIINFVMQTRSKLLIRCPLEPSREFWASFDILQDFIKNNNATYRISGKILFVFPWRLFHGKPNFSGA